LHLQNLARVTVEMQRRRAKTARARSASISQPTLPSVNAPQSSQENAMGAWSHESFGNDDACDFAADLAAADDLSLIESTFDTVLEAGDDYLEAPEASQAIAAAEAVARLQGNWGVRNAYSEEVDGWVERTRIVPPAGIVQKAQLALDRVMAEPSELLELWQEGDGGEEWTAAVRELRGRLRA